MSCQKPSCTRSSTDTYNDEHGNELELCEKHYYELVSGESVPDTPTDPLGLGTDNYPRINPYDSTDTEILTGRGVLDEMDLPDRLDGPDSVLKHAFIGNTGTTPCPDCGKPMGMVTWHGEKPSCHRCQQSKRLDEYSPWMGVLDPITGEEVGPTMSVNIDTVDSSGDYSTEFRAAIE